MNLKSLIKQSMPAENEKELQAQIVTLLRSKGIEPIVQRYGKKTSVAIGTPDILFCCNTRYEHYGYDEAHAWEIKHGDKSKVRPEQEQMHVRLSTPPNAWTVKVIRSLDEAKKSLREMGL